MRYFIEVDKKAAELILGCSNMTGGQVEDDCTLILSKEEVADRDHG